MEPTTPTLSDDLCAYAQTTIHHEVKHLIGRFGYTEADLHDLEQEVMLQLLIRLQRFDATRAAPPTFIARVVPNIVTSVVRGRCALWRGAGRERSLDDSAPGGLPLAERLADPQAQRPQDLIDTRDAVATVMARLTPRQRRVCQALMREGTTADAARRLRLQRSRLYEIIVELRAIFSAADITLPS